MPERNPFEKTATAGSRPGYSQPDTRFGGNLERANIRTADPPTWSGDRQDSSSQSFPSDRNIGGYDPDNQLYNTYLDEGKYDPYVTAGGYPDEYGSKIPTHIVYQDAEMGEPGAVLVDGQWKKHVLNKIGGAIIDAGTTGTYDDEGRFTMDPFLGTEKGDMFTGIPTAITEENIPGIKESLNKVLNTPSGSSMPGGPNYGGHRGSGGHGGYPMPWIPGIMQGDPQGENRYAPLGINEFMVNVHSPMYANRGGIMNLLGDY